MGKTNISYEETVNKNVQNYVTRKKMYSCFYNSLIFTQMGKADINEVLTSHYKWLSTSGWVLRFNWSFNSIKFDLLECHTKEINQSPIDLFRFYFTNQTLFTH